MSELRKCQKKVEDLQVKIRDYETNYEKDIYFDALWPYYLHFNLSMRKKYILTRYGLNIYFLGSL